MSDKTGIEWTDATWNPIRGCSRVSEGCRHCYAETVAARFSGKGLPYEGLTRDGKWNGQIMFVPEHLSDPIKWKRPRRIFVNSMSDLFHENVSDIWIDQIFAVMALCPQHTFQVLTKRPERMREYCEDMTKKLSIGGRIAVEAAMLLQAPMPERTEHYFGKVLPNVWLGVSVEDQATADVRIPELLKTPAAVRFVSYEPALGPVDFLTACGRCAHGMAYPCKQCRANAAWNRAGNYSTAGMLPFDWLICGGESGPGARPMHPAWARSAREQCQAAGVKFFFKQWGEWEPLDAWQRRMGVVDTPLLGYPHFHQFGDKIWVRRVGKKLAGRVLDGRTWDEMPEGKLK